MDHAIPEYCLKPVLVLGCGNVLFGDDGFGPSVIEYISRTENVPRGACLLDVGTAAREVLFDITLSDHKPRRIIVVDAMDSGKEPGTVMELDLGAIPENKSDDFSMHQVPTSNLLRELRDFCAVEVVLIVYQPAEISKEVNPGLSGIAKGALRQAAEMVLARCGFESVGA